MILIALSTISSSSWQLYLLRIYRNCVLAVKTKKDQRCVEFWVLRLKVWVNFLGNVVSLSALTTPLIHPQEENMFSQQLLDRRKTGFWFCFHFLLPLALVEFKASEITKSVVNGSQGSHSRGHVAVIMNFDLDLQFEQSPGWDSENSLIPEDAAWFQHATG